jgi:hypothetical protein
VIFHGSQTGPPLIDPAGGRIDLAVLLLVAVLGDDEHGRQGKDRFLSRSHQDRSHGEMPVEGGSIRLVGLVAGGTGDLLRLEKVQAVEGHEKGAPDRPERLEQTLLVGLLPEVEKERRDLPGRDRIQQGADLVVGRDPMDPEERTGVVLSSFRVHLALVLEEGGRLDEEDPESCEGGIVDFVAGVVPGLSGVGKGPEGGADAIGQRPHGKGHPVVSSGCVRPSLSRKWGTRGRRKISLTGRAH